MKNFLFLLSLPLFCLAQTNATDWVRSAVSDGSGRTRVSLKEFYDDNEDIVLRVDDVRGLAGKRLVSVHVVRDATSTNEIQIARVPFPHFNSPATNWVIAASPAGGSASQSTLFLWSPGLLLYPRDLLHVLPSSGGSDRTVIVEVE
jgi:hypothetical protein